MPGDGRVRVVGCGNPVAGDDALGVLAVRVARAVLPADVDVIEAAAAVQLVDLMDGIDALIVVDAVRTPSGTTRAGALVRIEAGPDGLPTELRTSLSSHGLGVAEAVGLAAALGALPHVVFLGLEVATAKIGEGLSPAVETGLPRLVSAIAAEAAALAVA